MDRWRCLFYAAILPLLLPLTMAGAAPRLRYPIAAAWVDSTTIAVANERSGSLSLVDVVTRKVREEIAISGSLTDFTVSPDRQTILIPDSAGHRLVRLTRQNGRWASKDELSVAKYPASVELSANGKRAFVVGLWSRRLDIIALDNQAMRVTQSITLPWSPRAQLLLPDQRHLVIAAAFGGQLAVVDVQAPKVLHVRPMQSHNIASLAWDEQQQQVLVAHQILLETAATDVDNIQWGALMKNVVRLITRDQLLDPKVNLTTATRVISIGSDGAGEGDPTCVLPLADGGLAVTSGGMNNLVRIDPQSFVTARLPVGQRPVQVLPGQTEATLVVVNQFSDSLSLVDLATNQVVNQISLGEQPTLTPAERGERHFYSAELSYDGWMSCHSCHPAGYANGLRADTSGDGNFGAPKRTLSLLGIRDTDRWAWDGSIQNLPDQVRKSISTTLHGEATAENVFDIVAFLHTLEAPPPLQPVTSDVDRQQVERGRAVFVEQRCDRCHVPPLTYTSQESYDVGLADEHGQKKFNPPSLRGVGQGSAFFHDSRAQALEDVFQVHGHQLQRELTNAETAYLLRFLRSL